MRLALGLALWAAALPAQDAGMVQAASRRFQAQQSTLPLTTEQRNEAGRLDQEAQQESQAGRFGEALRRYAHALAVMRGVPWTPAVEFASSLEARTDHALRDPGQAVTLSLVSLYPCGPAAEARLQASVFLTAGAAGSEENEVAHGATVDPARLPFTTRLPIPSALSGNYRLEVRLRPRDGIAPEALREAFRKSLPLHIEALSHEAQRLRERLAHAGRRDGPALPTAEYVLAFYERADRGEEGPRRYQHFAFGPEFSAAHTILDEMEAGRDPFAGRHGDSHRAYRSSVDRTLQPYRIFIPESYDGSHPAPLLVALHGAGGDENDMFDGFPGASLTSEAGRVGFLVVCPRGRGPNSGYRGAAAQDVLDVLMEVRRAYRIDAGRIYLMGHSMGAFATWRLAMEHPGLFAGLGLIAGGGDPRGMGKIAHIPQYVVHGAADRTVPVSESRRMVEAGRRAGARIVYVEVPGAGHIDATRGQFGPMLEFLAKQQRVGEAPER